MTNNQRRIESRVKEVADFILGTEGTIRRTAKHFGVSATTVHKDLVDRLPDISLSKARMVQVVLQNNKAICHIRGGYAFKRRCESKKIA